MKIDVFRFDYFFFDYLLIFIYEISEALQTSKINVIFIRSPANVYFYIFSIVSANSYQISGIFSPIINKFIDM